ncbi:MAG: P-loop NTPase [Acidimicrobiales bacterium]
MKIAVTGKGGSGKSTVAGALARQLARSGNEVVAIDADPNPNLGVALGVGQAGVESLVPILNGLLAAGHTHDDPTPDPDDLLERFGLVAPDGVRLVATGKIERPTDSCLCCGSHSTTRAFFGALPAVNRVVVADLEAGLNDLIWAKPGAGDCVLVVADPSAKAVDIARRGVDLAHSMGVTQILGVANRCAGDQDRAALARALGIEVISIPEDPAVEKANAAGVAPLDASPDSPAMMAIAGLVARLAPRRAH